MKDLYLDIVKILLKEHGLRLHAVSEGDLVKITKEALKISRIIEDYKDLINSK